jgi:hypothetical protein
MLVTEPWEPVGSRIQRWGNERVGGGPNPLWSRLCGSTASASTLRLAGCTLCRALDRRRRILFKDRRS